MSFDRSSSLGRPIVGTPNFSTSFTILALGNLLEAGLGDVGQRGVRRADVVLADHVAHADAQVLGVLEAVQDRVDILGAFAQLGQRLFENRERRQLLDEQAVHQLVDHAGVAGEDAGEVRAGGAQPHVQFERRRG